MRKQIAAANWKMNLTLQQAETLVTDILNTGVDLQKHQEAVFGVPFPYIIPVQKKMAGRERMHVAAQNCYSEVCGAYT